ncbi:Protein MKT1 [Escovopsis weberi]|uniref:Protein MKT1 n=1 Tax=Escovopsis weberi TaxID=150374 RepID=A0A0M9VUA9_ESCWE|nr:Protein MKT1 [Escovopsis weberi]
MPFFAEDSWLNSHASTNDIAELEECAIAVDATYYLGHILDTTSAHEPLLPALGGLTGQDEVTMKRAKAANRKTEEAWHLYSQTQPEQAVATFGANPGAYRLQNLYPLLQSILKQRGLHFLVAPYNACAQLAYFELINSDQCAGVMGPLELFLYPITDSVIRGFDWENKVVSSISKKKVMRILGVNEPMFIDAMLMTGTSFLPPFPPLQDASIYPNSFTIMEAINLLRTSDKTIANACASFNDIVQAQDPNWHDKYRKARMAVHHFIYITEAGEVVVNDPEHLTKDNHEYLGLQMPAELFHYLNTGLIGSRILNGITHGQIYILPTLEGTASDDYKKLVTSQIIPIKELTLGLLIPRVHRGIGHTHIVMRVWFDSAFSYTLNPRSPAPSPLKEAETWDVKEHDLRRFFPADFAGPVYLEVLALANTEFVEKTIAREKTIKGIDSTNMVTSVAIWRFLHLRGYADDSHKLTKWGNALATSLLAVKEAVDARVDVPGIEEAVLLAFEVIQFGLLNGKNRDTSGMPRKGTDEDKTSLLLISQCATLLKLRHQAYGYTGPLNRSLLNFRALSSTIREADRDLIEAIVASMFMHGQAKRDRSDQLTIGQRLPFSQEPDIALGIAIQTFFDEDEPGDSKEQRAQRLRSFPESFVPFAEALEDDFRICCDFVSALNLGIQTLDTALVSSADKAAWQKAQDYITARPF